MEPLLPIHHLVNNAGIAVIGSFLDIDLPTLQRPMDVNYYPVVNVSQIVAKGMIQHEVKNGTIVNMSSIVRIVTVTIKIVLSLSTVF